MPVRYDRTNTWRFRWGRPPRSPPGRCSRATASSRAWTRRGEALVERSLLFLLFALLKVGNSGLPPYWPRESVKNQWARPASGLFRYSEEVISYPSEGPCDHVQQSFGCRSQLWRDDAAFLFPWRDQRRTSGKGCLPPARIQFEPIEARVGAYRVRQRAGTAGAAASHC